MILDRDAITFAKVRGNPWDLAAVVDRMRALSRRFPKLAFRLDLQPDGSSCALHAGEIADREGEYAALASWVAAHPSPRLPEGELRARLTCRVPKGLRGSLREAVARWSEAASTEARDGIAFAVERVHELALLLDGVAGGLLCCDATWRCELELTGPVQWRCSVSELVSLFALRTVVATMLRDVPRAEPVRAASPDSLPAAPQLARVAATERLALELDDKKRFELMPDGRFELLPPSSRGEPQYQRELGMFGDARVTADTLELALGRNRDAIAIHARDGSVRTSEPLINAAAFALDAAAGRVVTIAERDGSAELVAIDLGTLERTSLQSLGDHDRPYQLYLHAWQILGLIARDETVKLVRIPDDTIVALIPERLRRGDLLILLTNSAHEQPPRTSLHELAFDGSLRSVVVGDGRNGNLSFAGDWLAWNSHEAPDVRLFERLELRRTLPAPPDREPWSIEVSPTGAVACVSHAGGTGLLELFRGDAHVELAVPPRTGARWLA